MAITKQSFGKSTDGTEIFLYEITNTSGAMMKVTDFGAILVSLMVPDENHKLRDVVLGYDTVEGYYVNPPHFGSPIGRNGNRIGNASFTIDGVTYQLEKNDNGKNNLHSGPNFYRTRVWDVAEIDAEKNSITFSIKSPRLDQGFPGNFTAFVSYTLTEKNELVLDYKGTADKDTIVNMTNHSYFNLAGHDAGAESVMNHLVQIHAEEYTPTDKLLIPTGEIAPVAGTPMDFTTPKKIGQDVDADFEQLIMAGGYDHNYALTRKKGEMREAAVVWCEESGIQMKVYTDLPGMQFYIGNFIEQENGKAGCVYGKRSGFCMETQYYPNACNEEKFESSLLKAGEEYHTTTVYAFSTK